MRFNENLLCTKKRGTYALYYLIQDTNSTILEYIETLSDPKCRERSQIYTSIQNEMKINPWYKFNHIRIHRNPVPVQKAWHINLIGSEIHRNQRKDLKCMLQ